TTGSSSRATCASGTARGSTSWRVSSARRQTLRILRQRVADLVPGRLVRDEHVHARAQAGIFLERAQADAHDVGLRVRALVERRAAAAAERADRVRRRLVLADQLRARGQHEVVALRVGIRAEGAAAGAPALAAVAVTQRAELARDLVADPLAQT